VGDDKQPLTAADVAEFLAEQPEFFQDNPDVLDGLALNNAPEGTISLAQRQIENLRKKSTQLQEQLNALLDNAHSNSELQARIHSLCLSLMDTHNLTELLVLLVKELKQEFLAEFVSIRLFTTQQHQYSLESIDENIKQLALTDESLKAFDNVISKQQPVCGRLTKAQKELLFADDAQQVNSVACLPLADKTDVGLLAIASTDANRFHSDMGTVYLSFLSDIVVRLLRQHSNEQN
jgi:hypothetical protein